MKVKDLIMLTSILYAGLPDRTRSFVVHQTNLCQWLMPGGRKECEFCRKEQDKDKDDTGGSFPEQTNANGALDQIESDKSDVSSSINNTDSASNMGTEPEQGSNASNVSNVGGSSLDQTSTNEASDEFESDRSDVSDSISDTPSDVSAEPTQKEEAQSKTYEELLLSGLGEKVNLPITGQTMTARIRTAPGTNLSFSQGDFFCDGTVIAGAYGGAFKSGTFVSVMSHASNDKTYTISKITNLSCAEGQKFIVEYNGQTHLLHRP